MRIERATCRALNCSTRRVGISSAQCGVGLGRRWRWRRCWPTRAQRPIVPPDAQDPLAPRPPHFSAKAKRVIFMFMAGGPSQLELFDYKPKLQELDGQVVPPEYTKNKRFAFIKGDAKLLGTKRKFARHGECGAELSELLPHLAHDRRRRVLRARAWRPTCSITARPSCS